MVSSKLIMKRILEPDSVGEVSWTSDKGCVHVWCTLIGRKLDNPCINVSINQSSYSGPHSPQVLVGVGWSEECGDDLYRRVIISRSWDNITAQIRTIPFHWVSNVHDEMRRFISYIYEVIIVNLRSPSIGGLRKQLLEASQDESKGNPNDINEIIAQYARWPTVTIKLLIKENVSCHDTKIFHGTNTAFVSLVSTWMIGKFLQILLSEIFHRLCLI